MAFIPQRLTWQAAEKMCQQTRGHLATVGNATQIACATAAMTARPDANCAQGDCTILHIGLYDSSNSSDLSDLVDSTDSTDSADSSKYRWIAELNRIFPADDSAWALSETHRNDFGFWYAQEAVNFIGTQHGSSTLYFLCQRWRDSGTGYHNVIFKFPFIPIHVYQLAIQEVVQI